jgi:hypothetical protein
MMKGIAGVLASAAAKTYAQLTLNNPSYTSISETGTKVTRSSSANWYGARADQGKNSGKWYFEIATGASAEILMGFANSSFNFTDSNVDNLHISTNSFCWYVLNGSRFYNNTNHGGLPILSPPSAAGIKVDLDNKLIYITLDGTNYDVDTMNYAGYPDLGTTIWYPCAAMYNNSVYCKFNFGATSFVYPVPAGYNSGWYE